ncbi:hypothetical protein [Bacillus pumilus]|uniref:hypothetical protein n=1 Tax=Bacillus pumilus TaxID=1408 RepID=UPI001E51998B|nr:hypothetical protein [Bacillus pumilus]MCC9087225.1 hypothetical protein [Bacillus pumilus]
MNINKIRSFLYKTSKYLGDVNAVQKGTIGKRIMSVGEIDEKDIQIKKKPLKRAFLIKQNNRYLLCVLVGLHYGYRLMKHN